MRTKNMQLVINVKIPKKLVQEMNIYRKIYHPSKLSHSQAHITLVPPFILRGKLTSLLKDIERILTSQRPFKISIDGIGSFRNDVIFFKSSCPLELKKIQKLLKQLVGRNYLQRRYSRHDRYWRFKVYRPHVTIAADKPENVRKYKKELKGLRYKRQFKVIGVGLYFRRKDKKWILKREFLFSLVVFRKFQEVIKVPRKI